MNRFTDDLFDRAELINLSSTASVGMPFVPPSEEEKETVSRLRESLVSYPGIVVSPRITDVAILRFLRGSKQNSAKALEELVRHARWRVDSNADDIDSHIPRFQKQLDKQLSILDRFDKTGRPALFCFAHRHNASDRDLEEMIFFIVYSLETLVRRAKPEEEMFMIAFDLSRFSMRCMDFEVVKHLINILQKNYPDTLEKFFIVDAPFIFQGCWVVIRPWIDPVTAQKVAFIKRAELEEHVELEQIPSFEL